VPVDALTLDRLELTVDIRRQVTAREPVVDDEQGTAHGLSDLPRRVAGSSAGANRAGACGEDCEQQ
jgi:hypothetical protein